MCSENALFHILVGWVSEALPIAFVPRPYLSSATGLTATAWGNAIRGHWSIENRNHYVRDVSCDEDKCRIRDNPGIMARARSFALNILRKNHVANVAKALWDGALSLDHILAYKEI